VVQVAGAEREVHGVPLLIEGLADEGETSREV